MQSADTKSLSKLNSIVGWFVVLWLRAESEQISYSRVCNSLEITVETLIPLFRLFPVIKPVQLN